MAGQVVAEISEEWNAAGIYWFEPQPVRNLELVCTPNEALRRTIDWHLLPVFRSGRHLLNYATEDAI